MTCDEYRKTCMTVNPSTVSRGERAAVLKHGYECRECAAWLSVVRELSPPLTDEQRARHTVIIDADFADPEYVDTIKEGLNREARD